MASPTEERPPASGTTDQQEVGPAAEPTSAAATAPDTTAPLTASQKKRHKAKLRKAKRAEVESAAQSSTNPAQNHEQKDVEQGKQAGGTTKVALEDNVRPSTEAGTSSTEAGTSSEPSAAFDPTRLAALNKLKAARVVGKRRVGAARPRARNAADEDDDMPIATGPAGPHDTASSKGGGLGGASSEQRQRWKRENATMGADIAPSAEQFPSMGQGMRGYFYQRRGRYAPPEAIPNARILEHFDPGVQARRPHPPFRLHTDDSAWATEDDERNDEKEDEDDDDDDKRSLADQRRRQHSRSIHERELRLHTAAEAKEIIRELTELVEETDERKRMQLLRHHEMRQQQRYRQQQQDLQQHLRGHHGPTALQTLFADDEDDMQTLLHIAAATQRMQAAEEARSRFQELEPSDSVRRKHEKDEAEDEREWHFDEDAADDGFDRDHDAGGLLFKSGVPVTQGAGGSGGQDGPEAQLLHHRVRGSSRTQELAQAEGETHWRGRSPTVRPRQQVPEESSSGTESARPQPQGSKGVPWSLNGAQAAADSTPNVPSSLASSLATKANLASAAHKQSGQSSVQVQGWTSGFLNATAAPAPECVNEERMHPARRFGPAASTGAALHNPSATEIQNQPVESKREQKRRRHDSPLPNDDEDSAQTGTNQDDQFFNTVTTPTAASHLHLSAGQDLTGNKKDTPSFERHGFMSAARLQVQQQQDQGDAVQGGTSHGTPDAYMRVRSHPLPTEVPRQLGAFIPSAHVPPGKRSRTLAQIHAAANAAVGDATALVAQAMAQASAAAWLKREQQGRADPRGEVDEEDEEERAGSDEMGASTLSSMSSDASSLMPSEGPLRVQRAGTEQMLHGLADIEARLEPLQLAGGDPRRHAVVARNAYEALPVHHGFLPQDAATGPTRVPTRPRRRSHSAPAVCDSGWNPEPPSELCAYLDEIYEERHHRAAELGLEVGETEDLLVESRSESGMDALWELQQERGLQADLERRERQAAEDHFAGFIGQALNQEHAALLARLGHATHPAYVHGVNQEQQEGHAHGCGHGNAPCACPATVYQGEAADRDLVPSHATLADRVGQAFIMPFEQLPFSDSVDIERAVVEGRLRNIGVRRDAHGQVHQLVAWHPTPEELACVREEQRRMEERILMSEHARSGRMPQTEQERDAVLRAEVERSQAELQARMRERAEAAGRGLGMVAAAEENAAGGASSQTRAGPSQQHPQGERLALRCLNCGGRHEHDRFKCGLTHHIGTRREAAVRLDWHPPDVFDRAVKPDAKWDAHLVFRDTGMRVCERFNGPKPPGCVASRKLRRSKKGAAATGPGAGAAGPAGNIGPIAAEVEAGTTPCVHGGIHRCSGCGHPGHGMQECRVVQT